MMRDAVASRTECSTHNTIVVVACDVIFVKLHSHTIYVHYCNDGKTYFSLAGFNTRLTRSRLNALGIKVVCKKGVPYYNGEAISSDKVYEVK